MTLDQVKDMVINSGFRYVKITDTAGGKLGILCGNQKSGDYRPEDIVAYLEKFYASHPGVYHLEFKKTYNTPKTDVFVYKNTGVSPLPVPHGPVHVPVDESALEKKIWARFEAKQKELEKERTFKDLIAEAKRKSEELDSAAGKLMHIGGKILNHFLTKNPALMGMLQGVPEEQTNTGGQMQTEPIKDLREIGPEEKQKCDVAMTLLLRHMHPDLLLALAKKIDATPGMAMQLKTFI
jgi:hypothetical protein